MENKTRWLDRPVHASLPAITNEVFLFALVILAALFTRFYLLEARVMSHDESLHTYFSYLLYKGQGYQHTPMMHGPYQFHNIALIYYMFGVSDFTSRIPAVLFSIATVGMVWHWRRYLGKAGALIAGVLLVISPFMLYYGRYVRNESFVGFSGIVMLYVILRYLETGGTKYIYLLSAALALHFTAKETSFIYTAQALIFLAVYFIARVTRAPWEGQEGKYRAFIITLAVSILLVGATLGLGLANRDESALSAGQTVSPANPDVAAGPFAAAASAFNPTPIVALLALVALIAAAVLLILGYTWQALRTERSFDLLIITGTTVLPMLSPFLVKFVDGIASRYVSSWVPVAIPSTGPEIEAIASHPNALALISGAAILCILAAIIIGMLWNREVWSRAAAIFWIPFTVLYTTVFTNSVGFVTGLIGSLGYWLVQQDVERGSQPPYYYVLVQIPIYEFLPAIGVLLAIIVGIKRLLKERPAQVDEISDPSAIQLPAEEFHFSNTFGLLLFWSITSIAAFSYAGERMPWLTYHMALPMILLTGWALGYLIDSTDWSALRERQPLILLGALFVLATSLTSGLLALAGPTPPFSGKDIASLQATTEFILPALVAIVSAFIIANLLRGWSWTQFARTLTFVFFILLGVLTARASFRASYVNYNNATEYLVYAHGAGGVKEVIAQATEISRRTTGGMSMPIAYDSNAPDTGVSWPMVWYLRDFTNQRSFDQPTRSLRDSVVVIVDDKNFDKIESALGPGFYRFDYIRMWWPNQDYFGVSYPRDPEQEFYADYPCRGVLSFYKLFKSKDYTRLCNAIMDPNIRAGIWDIWFDRDYTRYATATGNVNMTLADWSPADKMRMYIRADVANQMWNYGVAAAPIIPEVDPYIVGTVSLTADLIIDANSLQSTGLNAPRGLAFAPDGTLYVADSRNHRILHLAADGSRLGEWGTFADGVNIPNPIGTFNEPWGVAVGPDGSVYVSDTWNNRIQKFSAAGKPLTMWGVYGQAETPDAFWGPRGIAVDAQGNVYVADTGNKRIAIFDGNGKFINQFGTAGFEPGQFDEPVGVAIAPNGVVYVTDTWNQRVQGFTSTVDGSFYVPFVQWDINGWFGQSLDNKPFIAVNAAGHVFITDPEGFRVIEFDGQGKFIRTWGDFGANLNQFGMAAAVTVDSEGHIWVTDAVNQRILRFTLP